MIEFEVLDATGAPTTGSIEVVGGRYFLRPARGFGFSTGASTERTLKTKIEGVPTLVRGNIFVHDGVVGLRINEAHVGTDDPNARFISVSAAIELLPSLCTWRPDDGAARSMSTRFELPGIAPSPAMTLMISNDGAAVITAATPTGLDDFDHHLIALQDLVCFAADQPVERLSLVATLPSGLPVKVLGWNRFPPFDAHTRQPVEYLFRFGAAYAQEMISGWWNYRTTHRPVTQILAGLRYQPGWIETSVNILATCVELFGRVQFPSSVSRRISMIDFAEIETALSGRSGLNRAQRDFISNIKSLAEGRPQKLYQSIDSIVADLGETLGEAGINGAEWKAALIAARNGVSHSGGGEGLTDQEMRAVRDATRTALSLVILKQLSLPSAALARAAERLKMRYTINYREQAIYSL
tara:strand:+ start:45227 stop:46459 length:1233 start_codon:yes stop_codon:yes gene_type:complete